MKTDTPRNALLIIVLIFLALLFISPFLEPYGTFIGLDGMVGIMDHWSIWTSANPVSGGTYALGDILCHQMESRSFMLNGSQLAICERDLGMFIGIAIGLVAAILIPERVMRSKRMWYISAVLVIPIFVDWAIQYSTGFDSVLSRSVTGMLAGIGIAFIISKLLIRMRDDVLSK